MRVSYISIFTQDIETLPSFYAEVFDLREDEQSRSYRYRQLDAGALKIGFPFVDAYESLGLQEQSDPKGVRSILTFTVENADAVNAVTDRAISLGAVLVKPGFQTGFRQYLSVVLDPEGNAIRISAPSAID